MIRRAAALAAMVLAAAWNSQAAQPAPECLENQADLSVTYDATGGVRFCAPVVDASGRSMPDDALTRCVARFDQVEQEVQNPTPGTVLRVAPPDGVSWGGQLSVWCETEAGPGEAVTVDARFPAAPPGRPSLLP